MAESVIVLPKLTTSDSFHRDDHVFVPAPPFAGTVADQLDQPTKSLGKRIRDLGLYADERNDLGIRIPDVRGVYLYRLADQAGTP